MIISTLPQYYETLTVAAHCEAQLLRDLCVISRPLIQESLTHAGVYTPEAQRRLRRTLQDIYHGVDSLNRSSRGTSFPEPFYVHVTPEEAHLLRHFLTYTSAAALYGRLDQSALGRVGSLESVTTVWDTLRLRWTGEACVLGLKKVVVPVPSISSAVNVVA